MVASGIGIGGIAVIVHKDSSLRMASHRHDGAGTSNRRAAAPNSYELRE
jgi:hypothetical protein